MSRNTLSGIDRALAELGLCRIGAFHPGNDELDTARTVLLIGNAGSALWHRLPEQPTDPATHAFDAYSRATLTPLAAELGARILFPFDGPPYAPFVSWTFRTGQCHASRLGMAIHQTYGLWFALRAAFLFDEALPIEVAQGDSPCDTCIDKPCVSACPVGAFDGDAYAYEACRDFVGARPNACSDQGCGARRACPVGAAWRYDPDHAAYHMRSFAP